MNLCVAVAVVHQQARVLICQRRTNDAFGDLWEFPGGKVEPGETPEQCLDRELREELGVRIARVRPFSLIQHDYPNLRVHLIPWLCTLTAGEPVPLAAQRIAWVDADALRQYAFPAANASLIDEIVQHFHLPNAAGSDGADRAS